MVLGVDRGGAIAGGILAKHFRIPIRLLYRIGGDEGFRSYFDASEVEGKLVILVDDASRNGRSLEKAKKYVENHLNPKRLIVSVLLLTETKYRGHEAVTASKLVDYFAYITSRTDIKLPWDKGE